MAFQEILKDKKTGKEINNLKDICHNINFEEEHQFEYALLFSLDKVSLEKFENVKNKLAEETFIEARFFNTKKELFVFYDGERYKAVKTNKEEWKKKRICRPYILDKKFQENDYLQVKKIKYIQVIEFIDYDEDGQAYVKATCLHDIKEGEN